MKYNKKYYDLTIRCIKLTQSLQEKKYSYGKILKVHWLFEKFYNKIIS